MPGQSLIPFFRLAKIRGAKFRALATGSLPNFVPKFHPPSQEDQENLQEFLSKSERLLILTGAGFSTECGFPDYRSEIVGLFARKNHKPIQYQDFIQNSYSRQRYWARSYVGWPQASVLVPGKGHKILADWEMRGKLMWLVTQNVDGLHVKAGCQRLTELHGSLYRVACLSCKKGITRMEMQVRMKDANPAWSPGDTEIAPDGDAMLTDAQYKHFQVPQCESCCGHLKPDIVFFGDSVPKATVKFLENKVSECDALLVAGSTLQVYSSYRFVKEASMRKKPIAILNIGKTRGDNLASLIINTKCSALLSQVGR